MLSSSVPSITEGQNAKAVPLNQYLLEREREEEREAYKTAVLYSTSCLEQTETEKWGKNPFTADPSEPASQ